MADARRAACYWYEIQILIESFNIQHKIAFFFFFFFSFRRLFQDEKAKSWLVNQKYPDEF